ncbi:MAG: DNA repair protein RecN [bacterium]|nr:DNA repair protein RecN [bacterium]
MLDHLIIQNFALVEDVDLTFDKGMSVLTGETGAGKSVIVTALGLVLGDRADREHIRHGASKATVEATFRVERLGRQYKKDFSDYLVENSFTVRREISRDGSSKVKINGTAATVSRLKELASPLAEILGQHANQLLLDEDNHLRFLDSFASLDEMRDETGKLFVRWEKVATELKRTRAHRDELAKERELLLFQQKEIEDAQVRVGEEEEITKERRILDSSRTLIEAAANIQKILDNDERSVLSELRAARKELDSMVAVDPSLEPQVSQLADLDFQLEEVRGFVEQYGASVPDDPHRLEEINLRLDELYDLKQKYGDSEEKILKALERISQKLVDRQDIDTHLTKLEKERDLRRAEYALKALALTEVRKKAAKYLQKLVVKELAELAIDSARFHCEFIYEDREGGIELGKRTVRPFDYGLESLRFTFSANPGEPLKSLVKTASGGEISRVLLALKAAEKKNQRLLHSLMVFDEVDAGIGGQTAVEMGQKLAKLAEDSQVLVITHLHQIARLADHHFLAEKSQADDDRTTIDVSLLDAPAVKKELARMIALPEEEPV